MRVAFLGIRAAEPLAYGLMTLTSCLRRAGHNVDIVYGKIVEDFTSEPRVAAADVLGLSVTTGLHRRYLSWIGPLRRAFPDKCLVRGGPHATYFPETIEQVSLDGLCVGEGEDSFPEYLDAYQRGFPSGVPAGWLIRRDHGRGCVECGAARGPVRDLDSLPEPAYELFYDDPLYRKLPIRTFLATRGCPFRCSYCFNRTLNDRYRPYGPLMRVSDPERLCDWIERVRKRWPMQLAWFLDANFVAHLPWLESFLLEFPEVRRHLRSLIERQPNDLYRFLFTTRHDWMMRRVFYRATRRAAIRDVGTLELLAEARRDVGLRA